MLNKKIFVVTGVSSGIGAETARLLRSQGARVLGVDMREPASDVDDFHRIDLSDRASLDRLVAALPHAIDGLANIAGLPPTHAAAQVLRVNLLAPRYLTLALVPKLSDGASIVNLASAAGAGWPHAVADIRDSAALEFEDAEAFCVGHRIEGSRSYFFSKEALIAWTIQNRWTWRSRGIRMNAVSPGPVDTPILGDFIRTLGPQAAERTRDLERHGTPADIAPVVAFLLSPASVWMRGANLAVDGGLSAHMLDEVHGLSAGASQSQPLQGTW
ncbi:coniferyl-alcohol dehydrogenase [Variovorax sp. RCC_210]|uniref:coniferyl-alcohol dehydrogenase n=1 Tax=Variovorax sp. RCC_210 TaxID=3239217 RepID=UPI000D5CE76B